MKFLHTADWHIGKKLHGKELYEEQRYILNQILEQIDEHNPDFLIIAGDLYDKSMPSKEAITLLQEILEEINIKRKLPIYAISGNHDNRERLSIGKAWFSRNNYYLHTTLEQSFEKININETTNIYLMPYFDPAEARVYFEDNELITHHKATKKVIDKIYETLDESKVNILVAHTFVAGSEKKITDSEREISVGTVENVAVDVFEKFDYVALGHLHNPKATSEKRIKYSGSPLAYSFSEEKQQKGTRLVTITKENYVEEFLPLKPLKNLHIIKSSYDEVVEKKFYENYNRNDYFSMELSGLEEVTDPMPRLREYYPNLLVLKASEKNKNIESEKIEKVILKKPEELIANFYEEQMGENLTKEQMNLINKLLKVGEEE